MSRGLLPWCFKSKFITRPRVSSLTAGKRSDYKGGGGGETPPLSHRTLESCENGNEYLSEVAQLPYEVKAWGFRLFAFRLQTLHPSGSCVGSEPVLRGAERGYRTRRRPANRRHPWRPQGRGRFTGRRAASEQRMSS